MVNQVRRQSGMTHRVAKGAGIARVFWKKWCFALLGPFSLPARLATGPEPRNLARPQRAHDDTHVPYTVSGFLADLESCDLPPVLSSSPKPVVSRLEPLFEMLSSTQPPVNPTFFAACIWWGTGKPLPGSVPAMPAGGGQAGIYSSTPVWPAA